MRRTSGLAFDTRDDVLKGGKRGPAVKPGSPNIRLRILAYTFLACPDSSAIVVFVQAGREIL